MTQGRQALAPHRAVRIGVTGKIGSGKSTLVELMRAAGMRIIDSDSLAKEVMVHDKVLRSEIESLLGPEAYTGETLDRSFIASKIFQNTELRLALESLVHPVVRERMERTFTEGAAGEMIVVESALIFQKDLWEAFDYIVLVEAPEEKIRERLTQKFSAEDLENRLREQSSFGGADEADFTLKNDGSLDELRKRAETIILLLGLLSKRALPEVPLHQLDDEELEAG